MNRNIPYGLGLRKEAKKVTIDIPERGATSYNDVGGKSSVGAAEGAMELIAPTLLGNYAAIPGKIVLGDQGSLGGLLAHMTNDGEDKEGLDKVSPWSLIPGVGAYRNAKRDMYVDRKLSKGKNIHRSALAEMLGPVTSSIMSTVLGLGIGSAIGAGVKGKDGVAPGMLIGGGVTLGSVILANMIARLTGASKKTRTDKEHAEYLANDNVVGKYFIPGVASYHRARRAAMANNPFA